MFFTDQKDYEDLEVDNCRNLKVGKDIAIIDRERSKSICEKYKENTAWTYNDMKH